MAVYQIFIKLLDGRTQCLQISSPTLLGETLKRDLFAKTRIPPHLQRLISGTREIVEETLISASPDGLFPSVALLLRLPGGKGGFGSLLRGAATKAGQKKTNNFDACRDMSGRRLRHVNAEKKIEEWKAEAEDRKLEKLAEQYLKKVSKEKRKDSSAAVNKYLEEYRESTEKCMEEVDEAVRQSFMLYKESKRKVLPGIEPSSKRMKIWLGKKKVEESDSDDEEDEDEDSDNGDEKSVILDGANSSNLSKVEEENMGSASASGANSDGESLGTNSDKSIEEVNEESALNSPTAEQGSGSGGSNSESDGTVENETSVQEQISVPESADPTLAQIPDVNDPVPEDGIHIPYDVVIKESEEANKETTAGIISTSCAEEQLDFDKYDSASELEVLGLEQLKAELQARGLKCGGTLQERAARLFLLKTTPLEKLPKKLLAKPSGAK